MSSLPCRSRLDEHGDASVDDLLQLLEDRLHRGALADRPLSARALAPLEVHVLFALALFRDLDALEELACTNALDAAIESTRRRSRSCALKIPLDARLVDLQHATMSSPCQSGTPIVLRMRAPMMDAVSPTSRFASAASTAERSATTFLKTLRVIGIASLEAPPPRTRRADGT